MKHINPIRVYYDNTDAGGIVYHGQYLNFAERSRTEFLRHAGFENSAIHHGRGVMFVVRHIEIDYLAPAYLDDILHVETTIREIRSSSFIMHQRIVRPDSGNPKAEQAVIADMRVGLVSVDTKTVRPVRLPEDVKSSFQKYLDVIE